ncbi:MAG: glycerol-3-phosphate 1-O-acyltransferase [Myxococcota bacterium]|nr:glycerol-3-phosphate 1-O-acyltransferase [Myxococcota bacterium]
MAPSSALQSEPQDEPAWPDLEGRRPLFLLDASSGLERRLLEAWIERQRPADAESDAVTIPPTRRRSRGASLAALEEALAAGGDPLLAPIRVCWRAPLREGVRRVRFLDVLTGDPRDPGRLRQWWIRRRHPDRCRIVAGDPAPASELRTRWRDAAGTGFRETTGLAEFVARQAALALERAERRMRGARYKVPRLVDEDILGRADFRGGIALLARELDDGDVAAQSRKAARYLREIAATHSPFVIDLAARLIRMMYTLGYEERLRYDRSKLEGIKALSQQHPVVFMPSHKSNLDHLVLQYALHENGHPPNHTAGGINMNFFPLGPIVRRSGVFFIRRSFKDNLVYKFVLRHYIDYLVEKRFSLEWYIEGGRSRSGKLLPPRFGLLAYVVDAYLRGKSDDVHLIPVSIAYDQIQDVADYAAEQLGAPKEKESFGWFIQLIRRLRRRYGVIHFRFGEPLSLAKALGRPNPEAAPDPDEGSLAVQKLAFEVCHRINRVTPVTESSLLTLAMIGSGFRALSVSEVSGALRNLLGYVRERDLPGALDLELDDDEGVGRALDALAENGVVARVGEDVIEPLYVVRPEQQLAAAYYRNTVIHFFLVPSIAELSLLRAAEDGAGDTVAEFWDEVMRLRDLLKYEFFFAEKDEFRGELLQELRRLDPEWESRVQEGSEAIVGMVRRFRPFHSHRVLRPFLEAYRVAGDVLEPLPTDEPFDEAAFLERCTKLGHQHHLQRRVHSAASVSQLLFKNALKVARNRDALDPGPADLDERRRAFAAEIRDVVRRIEAIDALAASRRAGLIP